MEIPQIKDKITARAFALYLSIKLRGDLYRGNNKYSPNNKTVIDISKEFENYLIGDAKLPEVAEDYSTQIINMWTKLKEVMEKNETEMSKTFEELHAKLPHRTTFTEPTVESVYNETHS